MRTRKSLVDRQERVKEQNEFWLKLNEEEGQKEELSQEREREREGGGRRRRVAYKSTEVSKKKDKARSQEAKKSGKGSGYFLSCTIRMWTFCNMPFFIELDNKGFVFNR